MIHGMHGIYSIRHRRSGKRYVGSARDIEGRLINHFRALDAGHHKSWYLQNAWTKYGTAAFEWEVLEVVISVKHLIRREQHWIDYYDAANKKRGYNLAPIAGSSLGRKDNVVTRFKKAVASYGHRLSAEACAAISARRMGFKFTKATKRQMSRSAIARGPHSAESIAKAAASNTGKTRTAAQRERMGASRRGKPLSDAHVAALKVAWKYRVMTDEHKAAMRKGSENYKMTDTHKDAIYKGWREWKKIKAQSIIRQFAFGDQS